MDFEEYRYKAAVLKIRTILVQHKFKFIDATTLFMIIIMASAKIVSLKKEELMELIVNCLNDYDAFDSNKEILDEKNLERSE